MKSQRLGHQSQSEPCLNPPKNFTINSERDTQEIASSLPVFSINSDPSSNSGLNDDDHLYSFGVGGHGGSSSGVWNEDDITATKRNEVLLGVVISRWDNIVGPQCIYLWTEERSSCFFPSSVPPPLAQLIKYVTDHAVDHHDVHGGTLQHGTLRSAFCVVHDLKLVYLSVPIRVPCDPNIFGSADQHNWDYSGLGGGSRDVQGDSLGSSTSVPHAISILANLEFLPQFLLMRPVVLSWLAEFAPKVGVLLSKNRLRSSSINSWCAEICKTTSVLMNCWESKSRGLEQKAQINEKDKPKTRSRNAGGIRLFRPNRLSSPRTTQPRALDYLPPGILGSKDKSSLGELLTSHLSTGGSTIVVGSDSVVLNQLIRFLMCFSKLEDGYCSRYVSPSLPDTFMKGLFVQGLILGEIGERSVTWNQINSNLHPFTHAKVTGTDVQVRQMLLSLHKQNRDMILIQELVSLWNSTSFISPQVESFPVHVREVAGFVSSFLSELCLLKPERRYARVLLFRRMLHAKAISLITYLHSLRLKPPKEKEILIKKVRETLGLQEAEFLIVQVTAEKIRPGIMKLLQ